jgi:TRAP-type C4-dicarboxylate transport system permease large subunit
MIETFKGVVPFFASDTLRVALILAMPGFTLFLPHLVGGSGPGSDCDLA